MTGYTFEEFNALLPTFEEAVFECNRTLEGKERKNKPAAYSNSTFSSSANQLFFYFGLDEALHNANHAGKAVWNLSTEANLWIHYLMPILASSLNKLKAMPAVLCRIFMRKKRQFTP